MKCIVIQTSPERTNAHAVTDDNGAAHVYPTMKEARAELKANGYRYNRVNERYYLADAPEYRAYIIREDSEEYAEAIEQTEQDAAPEYSEAERTYSDISERIDSAAEELTEEAAQAVGNVVDGLIESERDYYQSTEFWHEWLSDSDERYTRDGARI